MIIILNTKTPLRQLCMIKKKITKYTYATRQSVHLKSLNQLTVMYDDPIIHSGMNKSGLNWKMYFLSPVYENFFQNVVIAIGGLC